MLILLLDVDGRVTYCNNYLLYLTGYSTDEIIGSDWFSLLIPGANTETKEIFLHGLNSGRISEHFENPIFTKERKLLYIKWNNTLLRNNANKIIGTASIGENISDQKLTKEALHNSEQTFHFLADVAPVGIFRTDESGKTLYVNSKWCEISGMSYEEALGNGWIRSIHPDDRESVINGWSKALKERIGSYSEYRFLRPDNSIAWVIGRSIPQVHPNGSIFGYIGTITDITERKLIEESLLRSEEKFNKAFQNSPDAITITRANDGLLVDVNENLARISGYSRDEILGKTSIGINFWTNPADRDFYVLTLKEKGRVTDFETNFRTKSGEIRNFIVSGEFFEMNGEKYILGVIRDVTERKQSEKKLQESENLNKILINQLPQRIFLKDKESVYLTCNDNFARDLGYSVVEIIGKTDHDLFPASLADKYRADDIEVLLGREIKDVEEKFIQEGKETWVHTIKLPYKDAAGNITGVLGIFTDISEQKHIAELLQYQSHLLKEMGRVAKIGGWEFDALTGKGSWTDEVARIHDFDPSEQVNVEFGLNFYHGEDRNKIENAVREAIESGKPYDLELQMISAKGIPKWVQTIGSPTIQNGKVINLQGSFQDITERKLAEEQLLKNEMLMRTAIENLPVIFYLIDQNGIFKLSVGAGLKGLGLRPNQVVGESVFEIYKDFPEIIDSIKKSLGGASSSFVTTVSGSNYDNFLVPLNDNSIKPSGIVGVALDITERKTSEEALRISERKYRRIFDNVQDIFYQIDLDGIITEISPSIFRLSGYRREDLIGKPAETFYYNPYDRIKILELVSKNQEVWDFEVLLRLNDGKVRYASLNAHLMFDVENKPAGVEGSIRDIEERKRFENDLISAKLKAEESDKLKTAFLHNISHEIRTPMNAIIGYSTLLGDKNISNEIQGSFIETIQSSGYQLLSIIDDIVKISSIEARIINCQISDFSINPVLKSLYNQFLIKSSDKNINLEYKLNLSDENAIIKTDSTKLVQIVSNLINNAIKFTYSGKVEFGYALKDSFLEFYVSDTGIGISSDQHSNIFKTFYQVESALSRQFEGTGLGLSICKAYTELLGGEIWVISELGKGATFFFTIPYKPSDTLDISDFKPLDIPKQELSKPYTILVAENDDNNYKFIEQLLTSLGSTVIRALNGSDAIEKCKSLKNIDLVLMDVKMPVLDGYSATREIRKFLQDLPIIVQTAYSLDSEKAIAAGGSDFISKPFTKQDLISKIRLVLKEM